MMTEKIRVPVIICVKSSSETIDEQLIDFSAETGSLFLDGFGDFAEVTDTGRRNDQRT